MRPIALISLTDTDRQWFKSNTGWPDVTELRRERAFCDHIAREERLREVPDAALDARFVHNPLVTGDPRILFYAGTPIMMPGGKRIGTVCVIDSHLGGWIHRNARPWKNSVGSRPSV